MKCYEQALSLPLESKYTQAQVFQYRYFKISPLLRNFFVTKIFPLTAMLNYLTCQVFLYHLYQETLALLQTKYMYSTLKLHGKLKFC